MTTNGKGSLTYKCRACGQLDVKYGVPDLMSAMFDLIKDGRTAQLYSACEVVPRLIELHACAVGTFGVCDLISGRRIAE